MSVVPACMWMCRYVPGTSGGEKRASCLISLLPHFLPVPPVLFLFSLSAKQSTAHWKSRGNPRLFCSARTLLKTLLQFLW